MEFAIVYWLCVASKFAYQRWPGFLICLIVWIYSWTLLQACGDQSWGCKTAKYGSLVGVGVCTVLLAMAALYWGLD